MRKTSNVPKLTKAEILRRRHLMTAEVYQLIIDTVNRIHGVQLKKRTVDAYIRLETIHRTGKKREDIYGIRPLFIALTDAEKDTRQAKSRKLQNLLEA